MLRKAIGKHKLLVVLAIISTIVYAGASLWQPQFMRDILTIFANTSYSNHERMAKVTPIGIRLILIALGGICGAVVNTIVSAKLAQEISSDVREMTYRKIQEFSYENIEAFSAGNLVVRLTNDVNQVQNLVMMLFQFFIRIPTLFIGAFTLAVITLPQLWWIIVVMVVLIGIITALCLGLMNPHFTAFQQLMDKINGITKQNLRGSRVVKSFVQEKNQIGKFDEASDELLGHNLSVGYTFSAMIPAFILISQFAIFGGIWWVSTFVTNSPTVAQNSLGSIMSFIQYMSQVMFSIIMGGMMSMFASRGMVSIGRIQEILKAEPAMTFVDTADEILEGSIRFDNVSFSYPNDEKATLKNITIDIQPGEMVGIVGATGAGKSTLAQLIPRLFDPTEGAVYVGGKNLKHLSKNTLKNTISIVLQKATLFSGTIAGNLKQGKADATEADMTRAARIAQAAEFIDRLPKQYEAEVEERGNNFSGGQKQRMSITRGVIKNPKVLILDDSTSALDARSEKLVQKAFEKELKGTTTIIIAQKISSVIHADNILVLDEGKLVGQGTHSELIKSNPVYCEIYNTQKAMED